MYLEKLFSTLVSSRNSSESSSEKLSTSSPASPPNSPRSTKRSLSFMAMPCAWEYWRVKRIISSLPSSWDLRVPGPTIRAWKSMWRTEKRARLRWETLNLSLNTVWRKVRYIIWRVSERRSMTWSDRHLSRSSLPEGTRFCSWTFLPMSLWWGL